MKKLLGFFGALFLFLMVFILVVPLEFNMHNVYEDKEAFDAFNFHRGSFDLNRVELDPGLCEFATKRVKDTEVNFSHDGFDMAVADMSAYNTYCPDCVALGENLARAYSGNEAVVAWSNSPVHNVLMLDPTYNVGCVMTNGDYTVLTVGRKDAGNLRELNNEQ